MSINSLEDLFEKFVDIRIPIEVLFELDNLKTAPGEKGFKARRGIRLVDKNINKFQFLQHSKKDKTNFNKDATKVDDIIIAYCRKFPNSTLITNDVGMRIKANAEGVTTTKYFEPDGFVPSITEVVMTEEEYEFFKEDKRNIYDILIGQFLCIKDAKTSEVKEVVRYLGETYWDTIDLKEGIRNYLFSLEPRDIHQSCAVKSLYDDDFTVIVGPAGTGKTLLSLAYCLKEIKDTGAKVHIFVNPVKTRDTEALGFYPGDRDEKLLQNFIGSILSNKIGDSSEVLTLIQNGFLNLYPFSDIRGVEITKGDIMYITEAQNLSIDLIKLAIQRCAEGSKIIIEGDPNTQVDKESFQDGNNGLKRVIKVFGGAEEVDFSYIYLPNIYRSKMASKAEEL